MKKSAAEKRAGEDDLSKASAASNDANRAFDTLMNFAYGEAPINHYAASCLVGFLTRAIGNFQLFVEDTQRNPKQEPLTDADIELTLAGKRPPQAVQLDFAGFARSMDRWPVLHYSHAEKRRKVETMLKELDLGADTGLRDSGFSFGTRRNQVVRELYDFIEPYRRSRHRGRIIVRGFSYRKLNPAEHEQLEVWINERAANLPSLSDAREVLTEWQRAGEELLPFFFGLEFWKHPHLRKLGSSAEKKKPKYCKELHERTREANVKAKVLDTIREGFAVMARRA